MLTPATTDAFMCMENVDPAHETAFIEALHTLKKQIETHLGGQVSLHLLDNTRRELNW